MRLLKQFLAVLIILSVVPEYGLMALPFLGAFGMIFDSLEAVMEFRKANDGFVSNSVGETDLTALTGGQVLQAVNIDQTMIMLAQTTDTYEFLNTLFTRDIKNTLVFFDRIKDYGDFGRKSFVGEMDDATFKMPTLERISAYISFLAEGYYMSKVLSLTDNIHDPETIQSDAAIHRIMTTLSVANWYGNRDIFPLEYNGMSTELVNENRVEDAEGEIPTIAKLKDLINDITMNNGLVNEVWMHNSVKQMLDNFYYTTNQFVLTPNQNSKLGYNIPGLFGTDLKEDSLVFRKDRWINRHTRKVSMIRDASGNLIEGKNDPKAPDTPTFTATLTGATVAGSKWKTGDVVDSAGNPSVIGYRIQAVNSYGTSQASAPVYTAANILAGYGIDIDITPAATGELATGFEIFRETLPGSGDYRLIYTVKRAITPTTLWQDVNEWRAGCSEMFIGDFNSRGETTSFRTLQMIRLLPLMQTKFAPSAVYQRKMAGMVEWYGGLINLAPQKFVMVKNVPTSV